MNSNRAISTKRVAVVVSKQQKKKNKSRSNARKGSSKIRQESIIYAPISQTRVMQTDNRLNTFRFQRKEFMGNITGTNTEFRLNATKQINPGNPQMFPWCEHIATCFESYKFHSLKFTYIPRCPTTTPGSILFCPDTNPKDAPPTTESEALQNQKSKSSAPWAEFSIVLTREMLNKRKTYFCRPLATDADVDLYDVGNLHIITSNNGAQSVPLGQMWMEYDVEFFTPEFRSPTAGFSFLAGGGAPSGVSSSNPVPNGLGSQTQTGNFIESVTGDGVQSLIRFQKDFHGLLNMTSTGTGLVSPTVITNVQGVTLNEVEGTWNGNTAVINAANTAVQITNLIYAKAGAILGIKNPIGSTTTNVAFALEECFV